MTRELRLELLLGRPVLTRNGRRAGRLEEVCVERTPDGWIVTEYLIGTAALFERLSLFVFRVRWPSRKPWGWRVRWDQLDLLDPARPRLTCPLADLTPL
jgi:hypothetical protein